MDGHRAGVPDARCRPVAIPDLVRRRGADRRAKRRRAVDHGSAGRTARRHGPPRRDDDRHHQPGRHHRPGWRHSAQDRRRGGARQEAGAGSLRSALRRGHETQAAGRPSGARPCARRRGARGAPPGGGVRHAHRARPPAGEADRRFSARSLAGGPGEGARSRPGPVPALPGAGDKNQGGGATRRRPPGDGEPGCPLAGPGRPSVRPRPLRGGVRPAGHGDSAGGVGGPGPRGRPGVPRRWRSGCAPLPRVPANARQRQAGRPDQAARPDERADAGGRRSAGRRLRHGDRGGGESAAQSDARGRDERPAQAGDGAESSSACARAGRRNAPPGRSSAYRRSTAPTASW